MCVLVGNKCDARAARLVGRAAAQALANAQGLPYIETSAKEDVNVVAAIELVVRALVLARLWDDSSPARDFPPAPPEPGGGVDVGAGPVARAYPATGTADGLRAVILLVALAVLALLLALVQIV